MVRNINAYNLLQSTLFDATKMQEARRPSKEVLDYLFKRLKVLRFPPSYVKIDWEQQRTRGATTNSAPLLTVDPFTEEDFFQEEDFDLQEKVFDESFGADLKGEPRG